jgi:hypothetical protein
LPSTGKALGSIPSTGKGDVGSFKSYKILDLKKINKETQQGG